MGLLKHLLFWPVTGPSFLTRFSLSKVSDTVREELTDDAAVKEELLSLQMRLELGDIDDDEYVALEAELMQRLRDVRHWREQFGMGTGGGPVRVARGEEPRGGAAEEKDAAAAPEGGGGVGDGDPAARGGIASAEGATVELNFDRE
jgi:hypothetical protein